MTRSADPLRELMTALAKLRDYVDAEYVPESPGWAQVFVTKHGAPAGRAVVVTNDGADWTVSVWPSPSAFYERENADAYESYPAATIADAVAFGVALAVLR